MSKTIEVDKKVLEDLLRIKEEFDTVMESIELMGDKEFMKSYRKSKKEVRDREFDDWNGL